MKIGILTGDPELENYVSKIGKRNWINNWSARINNSTVNYLKHIDSKHTFYNIKNDDVTIETFEKMDLIFYSFMDFVAAKVISIELYNIFMKLLKKYESKVYPPLKYTLMIADKCVYYAYLQKHDIPMSPFLCLSKNNRTNTTPKNIYNQIVNKKWNGFIGKPILGSSGTGFRMYPNINNVSEYEIYRQMRNHMNYVFNKKDFPKLMFQKKLEHFGSGTIPEIKMYYLGTKFVFGWVTYGKVFTQIGTETDPNSKYYISKGDVTHIKRFCKKVLSIITPLQDGKPLLITRVDIGCCLNSNLTKFNKKHMFINEVEFAPAFVLASLPGKYKKYLDKKIGDQILKIISVYEKQNKKTSVVHT